MISNILTMNNLNIEQLHLMEISKIVKIGIKRSPYIHYEVQNYVKDLSNYFKEPERYSGVIADLMQYGSGIFIDTQSEKDSMLRQVICDFHKDPVMYEKKARALIDSGANVNVINKDFYTILVIACKLELLSFVDYLINAGADVNLANCGNTPLMIACRSNTEEGFRCIELLLAANCDVKVRNFLSHTALIILMDNSNLNKIYHDILITLIRLSDVNVVDFQKLTAYDHYQLYHFDKKILDEKELLLLQGKIKNNNVKSARNFVHTQD